MVGRPWIGGGSELSASAPVTVILSRWPRLNSVAVGWPTPRAAGPAYRWHSPLPAVCRRAEAQQRPVYRRYKTDSSNWVAYWVQLASLATAPS